MGCHFSPKIKDFPIPFQRVSNTKVAFQYWEIDVTCGRMTKVWYWHNGELGKLSVVYWVFKGQSLKTESRVLPSEKSRYAITLKCEEKRAWLLVKVWLKFLPNKPLATTLELKCSHHLKNIYLETSCIPLSVQNQRQALTWMHIY